MNKKSQKVIAKQLSEEDSKELSDIFKLFDKQNNGKIKTNLLTNIITEIDPDYKNINFVRKLFEFMENSEYITYEKILEIYSSTSATQLDNGSNKKMLLQSLFAQIDSDNNGLINIEELLEGFKKLNLNYNKSDIQLLYKKFGLEINDNLSLEQFIKIIN